uniref:Uncharacterized protein n=1 Tax=Rhizophora mucronata TaxID=61149 RepID=A0A2P2P9K4_RHIMU
MHPLPTCGHHLMVNMERISSYKDACSSIFVHVRPPNFQIICDFIGALLQIRLPFSHMPRKPLVFVHMIFIIFVVLIG